MATIRKRSGNWQALVRRLGQKTLSQTFPTKAEAVSWARAKEAEIDVAERPVDVIELATTKGASVAMDQLAAVGIVSERTGYAGNRVFAATEVLSIINRPFGVNPILPAV